MVSLPRILLLGLVAVGLLMAGFDPIGRGGAAMALPCQASSNRICSVCSTVACYP